ncbi:hypothetical protein WHR41_02065 [Cladosporium halotolerans]|uniref:Uncharacterized protein n=1 Tax=Cladosporium halotolerans TaxID=1052096 RepID=A0AB34KZC8_9PEZI
MPFLRVNSLRQFQAIGAPALRTQRAAFSILPRAQATSDYGSGKGDPKGENPNQQGPNPSADKEHPGPPPPKEGQGSGSTPTKGGSQSSNSGQQSKGTQNDAKPKILSTNPPTEENAPQDVREHNEQMDQRAEKASNKVSNEDAKKDKVSKDFWKGTGGADNNP